MAKVIYRQEAIKVNKEKSVLQAFEVTVDYDPFTDTIDEVISICIYENNALKCEVGFLLDNLLGDPVEKIIGSIDWRKAHKLSNPNYIL